MVRLVVGPAPPQVSLDETHQVTVEDRLDVSDLVVGAQIFDHLIRLHHIASNLTAPCGLSLIASNLLEMGEPILTGSFGQLRPKHGHCPSLVLELGALVLTLDDDAGRDMGDTDRRIGGVDVLAAGTLRTVGVDPEIVVLDLDVALIAHVWHNIDTCKRGLPPCVGIERTDSDQTMDASLRFESPVGAVALDREGGRLDTGLVAFGDLFHSHAKTGIAEKPLVHAGHHLGPILSIYSPRARMNTDDRVGIVVLIEEQRFDLEIVQLLGDIRELYKGLLPRALVSRLCRQLQEHLGVVDLRGKTSNLVEQPVITRQSTADGSCLIGVVP